MVDNLRLGEKTDLSTQKVESTIVPREATLETFSSDIQTVLSNESIKPGTIDTLFNLYQELHTFELKKKTGNTMTLEERLTIKKQITELKAKISTVNEELYQALSNQLPDWDDRELAIKQLRELKNGYSKESQWLVDRFAKSIDMKFSHDLAKRKKDGASHAAKLLKPVYETDDGSVYFDNRYGLELAARTKREYGLNKDQVAYINQLIDPASSSFDLRIYNNICALEPEVRHDLTQMGVVIPSKQVLYDEAERKAVNNRTHKVFDVLKSVQLREKYKRDPASAAHEMKSSEDVALPESFRATKPPEPIYTDEEWRDHVVNWVQDELNLRKRNIGNDVKDNVVTTDLASVIVDSDIMSWLNDQAILQGSRDLSEDEMKERLMPLKHYEDASYVLKQYIQNNRHDIPSTLLFYGEQLDNPATVHELVSSYFYDHQLEAKESDVHLSMDDRGRIFEGVIGRLTRLPRMSNKPDSLVDRMKKRLGFGTKTGEMKIKKRLKELSEQRDVSEVGLAIRTRKQLIEMYSYEELMGMSDAELFARMRVLQILGGNRYLQPYDPLKKPSWQERLKKTAVSTARVAGALGAAAVPGIGAVEFMGDLTRGTYDYAIERVLSEVDVKPVSYADAFNIPMERVYDTQISDDQSAEASIPHGYMIPDEGLRDIWDEGELPDAAEPTSVETNSPPNIELNVLEYFIADLIKQNQAVREQRLMNNKEHFLRIFDTNGSGSLEKGELEEFYRGNLNLVILSTDKTSERPDKHQGNSWGLSDSNMFLSINPETGQIVSVSLPRDLRDPMLGGARINTVTESGDMEIIKQAFERATGQVIDIAIVMSMDALQGNKERVDGILSVVEGQEGLLEELGITIVAQQDVYDAEYPIGYDKEVLDIKAGQELSGSMIVKYMRSRHQDSDFGRMDRQQYVVKEVIKQLGIQIVNELINIVEVEDSADGYSGKVNTLRKLQEVLGEQQDLGNIIVSPGNQGASLELDMLMGPVISNIDQLAQDPVNGLLILAALVKNSGELNESLQNGQNYRRAEVNDLIIDYYSSGGPMLVAGQSLETPSYEYWRVIRERVQEQVLEAAKTEEDRQAEQFFETLPQIGGRGGYVLTGEHSGSYTVPAAGEHEQQPFAVTPEVVAELQEIQSIFIEKKERFGNVTVSFPADQLPQIAWTDPDVSRDGGVTQVVNTFNPTIPGSYASDPDRPYDGMVPFQVEGLEVDPNGDLRLRIPGFIGDMKGEDAGAAWLTVSREQAKDLLNRAEKGTTRVAIPLHEQYYYQNFDAAMRAFNELLVPDNQNEISMLNASGIGSGSEPDKPGLIRRGAVDGGATVEGGGYGTILAGGYCGPASVVWNELMAALVDAGIDLTDQSTVDAVIPVHDNHSVDEGYTPATSAELLWATNMYREVTIANEGNGRKADGIVRLPPGAKIQHTILNLNPTSEQPMYLVSITIDVPEN